MSLNTDIHSRLDQICKIILDTDSPMDELKNACDDFHAICSMNTGVLPSKHDLGNSDDIFTSQGKAVAPTVAAMCVFEYKRTQKFIQGVYAAIHEAKKRFSNNRVHLIYAGCGPYVTLILPLLTRFSNDELTITLIDISSESLQSAQKLIEQLQFESFIRESILADAATYQYSGDDDIHIVVTETMNRALTKEPHVAITLNWVHQLHPDGILVPENIRIELVIQEWQKEIDRMMSKLTEPFERKILGTVFDLNKETALSISLEDDFSYQIPSVEFTNLSNEDIRELSLVTTITTFGSIVLKPYESSLTIPYRLEVNQDNAERIVLDYEAGEDPKFIYSLP
jgi:predicted RNA methylase